jgi:hypothetical protein
VALHLDNKAIQWVGIWQGLKARTHLRATFATIRTILGIPWIIFPMLFSLAMSTRGSETVEVLAVLMVCWFIFGACLDVVLMGQARSNLRLRFRELAASRGP